LKTLASTAGEIWSAANSARLDQIEELAEAEKIKKAAEEESNIGTTTLAENEQVELEAKEEGEPLEPDESNHHQDGSGEDESLSEPAVPAEAEATPDAEPAESMPDLPKREPQPAKPTVTRRPTPKPKRERTVTPPVSRPTKKVSYDAIVEDRRAYQPETNQPVRTDRAKSRWPYVVLVLLLITGGGGWWAYDANLIPSGTGIKSTDHNITPGSLEIGQANTKNGASIETDVQKNESESVKTVNPNTGEDVRIETEEFTIIVERSQKNESASNSTDMSTIVSGMREDNIIVHVVVKGDTLWHIARRYIGDPFRYPELARLSQIKDPDWIYPGNIVRIIKKNK